MPLLFGGSGSGMYGGAGALAFFTGGNSAWDDGTAASPSIQWASDNDGSGTGFYRPAANQTNVSINGNPTYGFAGSRFGLNLSAFIAWTNSNSDPQTTGIASIYASQVSGGSGLVFASGATATTASRTEVNKAVASIANAVATDVLTITIPNAAHSASLLVRVTCSLGAGGAIGANEATATNSYVISINRTAGVNANAVISSAFGAAASAVAGAATVTGTAALSAVSGAVGATNTYTVQATVSRSGGSSTNHTCLVYAQLMNANATGITLS